MIDQEVTVYCRMVVGWKGLLLGALLGAGLSMPAAAQEVRPPELNVQYHRAETAWRSRGSMLEAKARVDQVLEVLPEDVEALKLRAQVLLVMGREAEALTDARHAVTLNPQDGEAHLILCEAARRTGDRALAERSLDAAASLVSDDPTLHLRLSWNAMLLGQLDKAEAFAKIAMHAEPESAPAYYQLARVFLLKDQPSNAVTVLSSGLQASLLDPDSIRADTVLVQLVGHPDLEALLAR